MHNIRSIVEINLFQLLKRQNIRCSLSSQHFQYIRIHRDIFFFRQMSLVNSCRLAQVIKHWPAVNQYLLQGHIYSTLRTVSKNTLTALRSTDKCGPRLTANWNSGERCTACRQDKRAEWKWKDLLDKILSLNVHLQQLLDVRYSSPTVRSICYQNTEGTINRLIDCGKSWWQNDTHRSIYSFLIIWKFAIK